MQILLIYPSGAEHIEDVPTLAHAEPLLTFGGDAFVLGDDGSRTPLAEAMASGDAG